MDQTLLISRPLWHGERESETFCNNHEEQELKTDQAVSIGMPQVQNEGTTTADLAQAI